MFARFLAILSLSAFLAAQGSAPAAGSKAKSTAPAATKTPAAEKQSGPAPADSGSKAASLPDSTVVLTVPNVCEKAAAGAECKTTVTKGEFQKLEEALKVPPDRRREFANSYAQLLVASQEARKLGVEKDPGYEERWKYFQMRFLASALQDKLQQETKVTDQDINNFYAENSKLFEETDLSRIMIPRGDNKIAGLKEIAQKLQARAAAGEPMDKLQAEAWEAAKGPGPAPKTALGWKRKGMLEPKLEDQLATLKAGQVSSVVEDPQNYYIYKVDSKRMVPMEHEKSDIERVLSGQKFEERAKQIFNSAKPQFNDDYFGKGEPQPPAGAPNGRMSPPKQ